VLDGILTGVASGALAGVAWWAIAAFTEVAWWPYLSALVGLVIGLGVVVGARRGGLVAGLLAVVISVATVTVAVYFIDRSLTISAISDAGRSTDVPLWQGFTYAKDVIADWIEYERAKAAGWLLAPVVALIVAGWPDRRPIGG